MHIVSTIVDLLLMVGCGGLSWLCLRFEDATREYWKNAEVIAHSLMQERDRVTVLERDTDALRRELRKLSGKFYASQREERIQEELDAEYAAEVRGYEPGLNRGPFPAVCENWSLAKQDGPNSEAAKCECLYCMTQRAERARVRAELAPKGAQAVATTARINGGKPQ